ncbi:aminodeoxychorismate lyase [Paenibacillus chartarius]|uniref:Aminodeoxychorismate lyase n=1 Tax=Paenibacillus chartarius TaxID=747481 RepID=A0ABV6DTW5_9BACL
MKIFMNGTLIEQAKAVVSAYDHGFLYGIGLFETFRTYGGRAFLLQQHLDRLADGCGQLRIEPGLSAPDVERQISELLQANGLADAYFRLTVTAGPNQLGLPSGEYEEPTIILYVKPLPPVDPVLEQRGKPLLQLRTARNTPEGAYRFKSLHYMNNYLAKIELSSLLAKPPISTAGTDASPPEGLMLTEQGFLAEGIVSNLFFIRGGCLYTPSLATGILPGITRAYVLELAAKQRIPVQEGLYTWGDLLSADEVFLTNSIQELVPVGALIDADLNRSDKTPGPITRQLLHHYRKEANNL